MSLFSKAVFQTQVLKTRLICVVHSAGLNNTTSWSVEPSSL